MFGFRLQGDYYKTCLLIERYLKMNSKTIKEVMSIGLAYYQLGMSYRHSGNYQQALAAFNKAIKTNSFPKKSEELASIYFAIALCHRDLKVYPKAISALQKSLRISPSFSDAIVALGTVLFERDNYQEAAKYLQKSISIEPNNINALKLLGKTYKHLHRNHEAIEIYKQVVIREPKNSFAHNTLGDLHVILNDYTAAERAYKTAIKLEPTHSEYYADLGHLYILAARKQAAKKMLEKAIELNSKSHSAYHYLGDLYFKVGNFKDAVKHYEYSIKLENDCHIAYLQLGNVYFRMNDPRRAILAFDSALKLDDSLTEAYVGKSLALDALDKVKQALREINKAMKIKREPHHFAILAHILTNLGDEKKAEVAFKKALRLCESNHNLFHNYATLLIRQNKFKNAAEYLDKSIKMDAYCSAAHSDLGWAYLNLQLMDEAITSSKNALRIDRDLVQAYFNIALAFLLKGDDRKALAWYSNAIIKDKDGQVLQEAIADFRKFEKHINQKSNYILDYLKKELKKIREVRS